MMSNEMVTLFLSVTYQAMGELGVRSVRPILKINVTGVTAFRICLLAVDSTQICFRLSCFLPASQRFVFKRWQRYAISDSTPTAISLRQSFLK